MTKIVYMQYYFKGHHDYWQFYSKAIACVKKSSTCFKGYCFFMTVYCMYL